MENGGKLMYAEFSKTFDKVPHDILVAKLVRCGLDAVTISCICSWLTDHTQRLLTHDFLSSRGVTSVLLRLSPKSSVVHYLYKLLGQGCEGDAH